MLFLAGVYWRVNVRSHTWNLSLTRWIITALQHRGSGRDRGLAPSHHGVSADKTNSSPIYACAFNGSHSTNGLLY